ncbi:hypothetical protein EIN_173510 [Entamoeba invadens IP1]|uniref:Uncharacterized protein n=1 Tax=Entamoeba invadens IP1 TaxID=370355 RepID=A0A0A1TW28_ENTIV|nr:hypothetical protein EIN_173510 [Entamoeba invadens IP1]ELP84676.1 hypothetical protein EIN_173510 [Entamoeba invadens IP1]|eukprot:XP_004184022.1 hypothetical protein EIN_173510 [Entamoeba invadens IP1]
MKCFSPNESSPKVTPLCFPGPTHTLNSRACEWNCGLIAVAYQSIIHIVNPISCAFCYAYNGHTSQVTSIAFKTNDFQLTTQTPNDVDIVIASGDVSGNVQIWGIWSTIKPLQINHSENSPVVCIQWDKCNASAIIVLYKNGVLICYDTISKLSLWEVKESFKDPIGFTNSVYSRSSFGVYGGQTMCFCNLASSVFKGYELGQPTTNILRVGEDVLRLRFSNIRRQITYILLTNHFLIFDTMLQFSLSTIDLPEEPMDFCMIYDESLFVLLTKQGNVYVYEIKNGVQFKLCGKMEITPILSRDNKQRKYTTLGIVTDSTDNSNLVIRMLEGPLILLKLRVNPFFIEVQGIIHTMASNLTNIVSKQIYSSGVTSDGTVYVMRGGEIYRVIEVTKVKINGVVWIGENIGLFGAKTKSHDGEPQNGIVVIDPMNGEEKAFLKLRNFYGEVKSVVSDKDGSVLCVAYQSGIEEISYPSGNVLNMYEKNSTGICYENGILIIDKNEYRRYGTCCEYKKGQFTAIACKDPFVLLSDTKGNLVRLCAGKSKSVSFFKKITKIIFNPKKDCYHAIILGEQVGIIDVSTLQIVSETKNYLTVIKTSVKDVFWMNQYPAVLLSTGEIYVLDIGLLVCCSMFKDTSIKPSLYCLDPLKRREMFFKILLGVDTYESGELNTTDNTTGGILNKLIQLNNEVKDFKHVKFWELMQWVIQSKLPLIGSPYVDIDDAVIQQDDTLSQYTNSLKNFAVKGGKQQMYYHAYALSDMRVGKREEAFAHFLKVLKSPYDGEYMNYAMRACLLSLTMEGNPESRQRLVVSMFNDPTVDKTHLIQLHKLLNQNREVCKLYIDLGKLEEAMVVASLFLDDEEKTYISLSIVLKYMFDNCWPKAIELLTSMGRLIDVVRMLLYTGHIEVAAEVCMVIIEYNVFDLDTSLVYTYQLIHVPYQDERKFKTLRELIKQVNTEFIHCLSTCHDGKRLVEAFKKSKYDI